jgi:hypothetical protein
MKVFYSTTNRMPLKTEIIDLARGTDKIVAYADPAKWGVRNVPGIDLHCSLHQRNKNGAVGRRFHIRCRSGLAGSSITLRECRRRGQLVQQRHRRTTGNIVGIELTRGRILQQQRAVDLVQADLAHGPGGILALVDRFIGQQDHVLVAVVAQQAAIQAIDLVTPAFEHLHEGGRCSTARR